MGPCKELVAPKTQHPMLPMGTELPNRGSELRRWRWARLQLIQLCAVLHPGFCVAVLAQAALCPPCLHTGLRASPGVARSLVQPLCLLNGGITEHHQIPGHSLCL